VAQLTELSRRQFEMLLAVQKHVLETADEIGEAWAEDAGAEGTLLSELLKKLASATTISDAVSAYQECAGRQFELLSQQNRRLFEDAEKAMTRNVKLFSNGHGLST